jgi:fructose transport system permease protein
LEPTLPDGDSSTVSLEHPRSALESVQHALHRYPVLSPLLVLVVSWIAFALLSTTGRFSSYNATETILKQAMVLGTLAVGQTLIVLVAGIDLSVGTAMLLTHVVIAKLFSEGLYWGDTQLIPTVPSWLALLLGLVFSVCLGVFHAGLITRIGLPPFIATLGTFYIFQSLGFLWSKAQTYSKESIGGTDGLLVFANRTFTTPGWKVWKLNLGPIDIQYGVLMMVLLYIVVGFALATTAWGRHVYAVGDDKEAARLAGINVNRVVTSVYVLAGVIYAYGAWVQMGRSLSVSMNSAADVNLESITAVVIGGTSLFGGRGRLVGTLLGALIVGVFDLGLSQAEVDPNWKNAAIGALIVVAVSLDQWIRKVAK